MKKIITFFIACSLIFSLNACGLFDSTALYLKEFSSQCGVDITYGEVIKETDTHGGFHGDGESMVVVQYSDNSLKSNFAESALWRELPLSGTLTQYVYEFNDSLSLPVITDGFYYFYDRNDESLNPYDDEYLLSRVSSNFTLGIYDNQTNQLYICEYDT